jgi:hypothetical protein
MCPEQTVTCVSERSKSRSLRGSSDYPRLGIPARNERRRQLADKPDGTRSANGERNYPVANPRPERRRQRGAGSIDPDQ